MYVYIYILYSLVRMHIEMLKWVLVHCTLMSLELKAAFHGSRVGNFGCSSVIHLCGVHSFCTRGIPIEINHGWQVLYWSLSWRRNILWVSCLKLSLGCVQNLQLCLVCLFEFGGYPLYVRHVLYISLLKIHMIWYDIIWSDLFWYDTIWYAMIVYDMTCDVQQPM